jgi:RpiB/LacA/LacB family sugar-phosphate isomerase
VSTTPGTVVLASDHGGFELKEAILRHLRARGVPVHDAGTTSKDPVDYPVFARAAAEAVARGEAWRGVIVDGAGIGSGMVANKVPGVRSAMAFDVATAKNAREHNDANVLTLGAGYLGEEAALKIVDVFLSTECTADRHKRRVAMIDALDGGRSVAPAPTPAPTRNVSTMAAAAGDYESLVQSIMQVLTANPALLAPLAAAHFGAHGGAPVHCVGGHCIGCGHCVSKRADTVRQFIGGAKDVRLAGSIGIEAVPQDLARLIDHTLLRAGCDVRKRSTRCATRQGSSASPRVCVNPVHVKRAAQKRLRARRRLCARWSASRSARHPRKSRCSKRVGRMRDGARRKSTWCST